MRLRDALDDHKRHRDHPTRFPGERRTTTGLFTGAGGRLLHVAPDGALRDFGYPLSGLSGLADSWVALELTHPPADLELGEDARATPTEDGGVLVGFEAGTQRYRSDTALVETVHETPVGDLRRYDAALETDAGVAHVTRFELEDPERAAAAGAAVVAGFAFAPDGRDSRVGQLRHERAVEVFHDREHDFLASAHGFDALGGGLPARPDAVLSAESRPRGGDGFGNRREEDHLGGTVVAEVGFRDGAATVATLVSDREEATRETSLSTLDTLLAELDSAAALTERASAAAGAHGGLAADLPNRAAAVDDLRALSLLSAPTGLRIAGPDFDPHYVHSGGYGYTWFRDDAEISGFLLEADQQLDLGLEEWHERSVAAYLETQRDDGTWPHRVWPRNAALAPGWANARLEATDDVEYQADQTASVAAFLARALADDRLEEDLAEEAREGLSAALDGMEESLEHDGRPGVCQNAWEDASGRFTHTAARFLDAYSAVAALGDSFDRSDEALARADAVHDALADVWVESRGVFAVAETDVGLDERLDSATFALADAHRAYDAVSSVPSARRDRLASHVEHTLDGLYHDPTDSAVAGLVRYEGDGWRRREQAGEKIWTVSTAWGANAAAEVSALLADADDARASEFAMRARDLLALVGPEGPLTIPGGYLPEQFFDDGTADSATPLGWPHAIRLATTALLAARDELDGPGPRAVAADD